MYVFWGHPEYRLMFFTKFGKFSGIISLNTFSVSHSFSSPSGTLVIWILYCRLKGPWVCSLFFSLFVHWCSAWVKSINLSSSLIIPSSVISILLLNLSSKLLNLGYCIFQLYNFHLILFYNFFADIFYFLICFKRICNWLFKHFCCCCSSTYMHCFKILVRLLTPVPTSDSSQLIVIHSDCGLPGSWYYKWFTLASFNSGYYVKGLLIPLKSSMSAGCHPV